MNQSVSLSLSDNKTSPNIPLKYSRTVDGNCGFDVKLFP